METAEGSFLFNPNQIVPISEGTTTFRVSAKYTYCTVFYVEVGEEASRGAAVAN